jgi:GrpB-like predicted nucleotidyltransferase (UPF0157 family)
LNQLLQSHDPAWQEEFLHLKKLFTVELNEFSIEVEHVGSTAIPGLIAKPILDIDIIIENKDQLNGLSQKLEKLGYINRGEQGIEGRFAFRQATDSTPTSFNGKKWMTHHLYVCFTYSLALKNHLLLRNALLSSGELATRYSTLKKNLAEEPGMTREKYTLHKTAFILSTLEKLGFDKKELAAIKKANS